MSATLRSMVKDMTSNRLEYMIRLCAEEMLRRISEPQPIQPPSDKLIRDSTWKIKP